ncbi:MAG: hypothetical protein KDD37_11405, partial [Bdellovibrionales bacterium]|nr:hypothetical protein [Bdellovibrionales bacterium]
MKKLVSGLIVGITFFTVGFIYEFHYPKLKQWVRTKVYLESHDNLPVLIDIKDLELSPFTLSAQLKDVSVHPKKDLAQHISSIEIESVDVSVSLISLILGRFEISRVYIEKPKNSLIYKQKKNAEPFKMPDLEFATLLHIPVDELRIHEGELLARLDNIDQSVSVNPLNLNLRKGFTTIFLENDLPEIKLKQKNVKDSLTAFGLSTKLSVSSKGTKLIDFKITKDDSFVVAKGDATGNPLKLEFNTPSFASSWNVKLDTIKDSINAYKKNLDIPTMSGVFEGNINLVNAKKNQFAANSQLSNFIIEGFDIGDVTIDGQLENKVLSATALIKNQLQKIEVQKIKLFLGEHYSFEGNIDIKSFELRQLLNQIKIHNVPLKLLANGNFPCSGVVLPKFYANCSGDLNVSDFYIKSSESKKNIVALKGLSAKGTLHVNSKFLLADANLKIGSSTGKANTRVDFLSGYRVDYSSNQFRIDDIDEISGLSIKGNTSISGYTEGNSKKGVFTIKTEGRDAYFENFYLGNLNTTITYANPFLKLNDIVGNVDATKYAGNIGLNFNKDTIDIKVNTPNLNLSNLPKILEGRVQLPMKFSGSGNIQAHIYGPLRIDRLNYDINGLLQRVIIGKESVDFIKLNSKTAKNIINLSGTELTKSRTKVNVTGSITTDGKLDVAVAGSDIRLEESETLKDITQNLNSTMNLKGKLTGTIKNPVVQAELNIKESSIGSSSYKGGKIEFNGNKDSGITRANLFNSQLVGSAQWNYDTKTPLLIEAVFNNWDYSPIFSLFSTKNEREGYKANINGKTFIQYDLNNFMNSKMTLDIYKFLLARGVLEIKNKENMHLAY